MAHYFTRHIYHISKIKKKQTVLLRNHLSLMNANDATLLYLIQINFYSWYDIVPIIYFWKQVKNFNQNSCVSPLKFLTSAKPK